MLEPADWFADWMAVAGDFATVIAAIGGLAALWFIYHQLQEMQDQSGSLEKSVGHSAAVAESAKQDAATAQRGIEIQQDNGRKQLRPYLLVEIDGELTHEFTGIAPEITVRNVGQTPAVKVWVYSEVVARERGPTTATETFQPRPLEATTALGPGAADTHRPRKAFSIQEVEAASDPKFIIYFRGVVYYSDMFGDDHETYFKYALRPRDRARYFDLIRTADGNEMT